MERFDFWIAMGDIHGDTSRVAAIPDLEQARGVIVTGDLTIKGGAREAERVLQAIAARNPVILAQVGNMDLPEVDALLERRAMNIHARTLELAPAQGELPAVGLLGVGASTPTPFHTPNEVGEEQMTAWLEAAWDQASGYEHLLLVSHDPPRDSAADMLPSGVHVGSAAVRAFIEKAQPQVCLTGHIHESRGQGRIGRTLVLNPGPLAAGGYALLRRTPRGLEAELREVSGA